MNPERRPLLMDAEVQGRSARPRPDVRSSPESALVDVKSEDEGTYLIDPHAHQILSILHVSDYRSLVQLLIWIKGHINGL